MFAKKPHSRKDLTPLVMFVMKWISVWLRVTKRCPIYSVAIETTQHCNRRCNYCPVSIDPKPRKFMNFQVFAEIVAQLRQIRFRGFLTYHFFNEPLLNRDLETLVRHASQQLPKARHVIFTNGDLLTSARAASLLSAGVDLLIVTDHGGRRTEYVEELESK